MAHESRDEHTAAHEAAHVVVGVALGLRVRRAHVGELVEPGGRTTLGHVVWDGRHGARVAWAIMFAAGVAWEQALRHPPAGAAWDRRACVELVGVAGLAPCVRSAAALLAALGAEHRRVAAALLERDLSGADLVALARGEGLEGE